MAVWKIKERYELARNNEDTRGDIGVLSSSVQQTVDKIQISTLINTLQLKLQNDLEYQNNFQKLKNIMFKE